MRKGYFDLKRPEILALIPTTAQTVLDLGCGTGALGKALKERQPCHVTGIELNKEASNVAGENLDYVIADNLNRYDPILKPQKYDCIILADILEHLIQPWEVLKKFAQVLEQNGTLIASIPNIAHPWIISQLQKGLFRYEQAGLLDITHLRFFTKTTIGQLFYKAGLKITKITPWPHPKNPIQYHITATKPTHQHPNPLATILILTYNAGEKTAQCLSSIQTVTEVPYKILVIDNGSTDGTVDLLRADNTIFHIENSGNLGFAGGFNIGLGVIDTPYFVISNSDVIMTHGWLKRMIEHISEDPKLMALGPRSNYVSGPQIVKNCTYDTPRELIDFAAKFDISSMQPVVDIKRIVFFCTLFKKEILDKIHWLDEIFVGGNFEDDDYCMRIHKAGFKTAVDNTVFIHHYGSQTFKDNKIDFKTAMEINGKRFLMKWKFRNIQDYYAYLHS